MTTPLQDITFSIEPNHALITLNRPERLNALTHTTIDEIKRCVAEADASKQVFSIVIRGNGRAFCAGDNLKGMGPSAYTGDRLNELLHASYYSLVNTLREVGKPVIVAAHGYTLGAGLEILMAGDIKLATADAQLGIPFAKLGIVGLHFQLVRYVGLTKAAQMIFTGDPISGAAGLDCGLVTEVIPDEAGIDAAIAHWTAKFAQLSPFSISSMKKTLYKSFDITHEEWFRMWMLHSMTYMNHLERGERVAAWLAARGKSDAPAA
ncbi:putative enoyl-CoA hydratase [Alphaproteobacteria bacterium SO-S41]|nr:putative enoyl-CoA hydratase [Alphaproteobacteria bacterium SO-S41]